MSPNLSLIIITFKNINLIHVIIGWKIDKLFSRDIRFKIFDIAILYSKDWIGSEIFIVKKKKFFRVFYNPLSPSQHWSSKGPFIATRNPILSVNLGIDYREAAKGKQVGRRIQISQFSHKQTWRHQYPHVVDYFTLPIMNKSS